MRTLILILGLAAAVACAPQSAGQDEAEVQPFTAFVAELKSAPYSDYASTSVASPEAFEDMRGYLLDTYEHAQVTRSFADNGVTFDCLVNAAATGGGVCPTGSAPMRRTTLADITRFATLQEFLARDPAGGKVPPTPPPT